MMGFWVCSVWVGGEGCSGEDGALFFLRVPILDCPPLLLLLVRLSKKSLKSGKGSST